MIRVSNTVPNAAIQNISFIYSKKIFNCTKMNTFVTNRTYDYLAFMRDRFSRECFSKMIEVSAAVQQKTQSFTF